MNFLKGLCTADMEWISSVHTLIIALIILIISRLLLLYLVISALAIVVYAYYRFFSKDIKRGKARI